MAESGCRKDAINVNTNGSVDHGAFQINSVHKGKVGNLSKLFDLETNVRVAAQIKRESGWSAWVVYNTGKAR